MERDYSSKKELVDGLKKAAQGNSRNKTARLREIFDDVEAAKASGLSLKAIVEVLADRGLVFDLATFVNVRHRIKNERARDASNRKENATLIKTELKDVSIENSLDQPEANTEKKGVMDNEKINEEPGMSENPFHKLSGKKKDGDFNPIPNHNIEIDKG